MNPEELGWESKLVLLVVLPAAACDVTLKTAWWAARHPPVAVWTLGLSVLLGLVTFRLRAATAGAAFCGAILTASLIYSTLHVPYVPWHTALIPVLAVSLLAFAATRVGREKKERLGSAEGRAGRAGSQVAANLGMAALVSSEFVQSWIGERRWFAHLAGVLLVAGLAALAEAAADTVSSEIGQVWGGRPRMVTTLRSVPPGTDGAVSAVGTLAGVAAAAVVAGLGTWALDGDGRMLAVSCAGGVFGLLFDSLLGATLELRGRLNNDAVNFLSTAAAAGVALGMMAAVG